MSKQKSTAQPTANAGVFALCSPDGEFLAHISEEDVANITSYRWHRSGEYVARTYINYAEPAVSYLNAQSRPGKQCLELLQRHVASNAGSSVVNAFVKFVDGDSRNCTRSNLVVHLKRTSKYYPAVPKVRQSGVFPCVPSNRETETSGETDDRQLELPF